MIYSKLQEILPFVKQPARYAGSEINSIKKDYSNILASVLLAFPDTYEIGTSHLGIQILYNILNKKKQIAAERVFAPDLDMARLLKKKGLSLRSLETGRTLKNFDIIGFSVLYELNYTNILYMLDLGNIPFFASERENLFPLIIAGGPGTSNSEPIADFFDAFVIGDGEETLPAMTNILIDFKKSRSQTKKEILYEWSKITGVYIPSFFKPEYRKNGFCTLTPKHSHHKTVKRAIITDFDNAPFPETPIIPFGNPIHDRLRIEVARGCSSGCRFCQAGMIYRPVREKSVRTIEKLCKKATASTGYEEFSLLSLNVGDYSYLNELIERTVKFSEPKKIAVSLPSMRADSLTPEMMNLIKKVRKTGFTIAPEAGSQRLRDVINKNITYQQIENTVSNAFRLGWQVIKLYFMIGLPTETDEDLFELIELVKKINTVVKNKNHNKGKLNISISNFVPKPHTPFQWEPQISLNEVKRRLHLIKQNIDIPGIRLKWHDPEVSLIEGLFSRGDRRLSKLILNAYKKGCIFDGWTDSFNFELWQKALTQTGIEPNFYTSRPRNTDEPLCWDHIDIRVNKKFLIRELDRALAEKTTKNCKDDKCVKCGVCDSENIAPEKFTDCGADSIDDQHTDKAESKTYKKYSIFFTKKNNAKYFGHLEMVRIFLRALKRAEIPLKFSSGFHPMPKVSFGDSLPLGIESEAEIMYITAADTINPQTLISALNIELPGGITIYNCKEFEKKDTLSDEKIYEVVLIDEIFDPSKLSEFQKQESRIIKKINHKGKYKETDLKKVINNIILQDKNILRLAFTRDSGIRPAAVLKEIFDLSDKTVTLAKIIKKRN